MIVQLKSSQISLKDLFKDLLIELKGFKYQITLKILLSKKKDSKYSEYRPVYFNSLTKIVISNYYFSDDCFSVIIYRIENWISHGSGWIVEETVSQYLNLSSCLPISEGTYVKLAKELSHLMQGLITIQNDDNKCFLWCRVRHLNFEGKSLWRITKKDREISKGLNYSGINFPVSEKDYGKISVMNKININVFCYENKIIYPIYLSDQCFSDNMDLLLLDNHYVLIKNFKD